MYSDMTHYKNPSCWLTSSSSYCPRISLFPVYKSPEKKLFLFASSTNITPHYSWNLSPRSYFLTDASSSGFDLLPCGGVGGGADFIYKRFLCSSSFPSLPGGHSKSPQSHYLALKNNFAFSSSILSFCIYYLCLPLSLGIRGWVWDCSTPFINQKVLF